MRTIVVIPAYNEERTVGEVVRRVWEHARQSFVQQNFCGVIVVDDGSDDATGECARHAGARVITHCINRGLGAALGTGLTAALGHRVLRRREGPGKHPVSGAVHEETHSDVQERADIIITLDADGQHDPADIAAVIAPIQAGFADLVIGTRFAARGKTPERAWMLGHRVLRRREGPGKHPVSGAVHEETYPDVELAPTGASGEPATAPWHRHVANRLANLLTRFLFGVQCSDTQSGFRAFSRRAASLIEIRTNRMEVSSEILAEAARLGLRITEVPIRTIYTEYSLSKGQSFGNGIRTVWNLLLRRWF